MPYRCIFKSTLCIGFIVALLLPTATPGQERTEAEIEAVYQRQIMAPTDFATALAGKWVAVSDIQPILDDLSERPDSHGRFKDFQIEFVDQEEFWGYRPIQPSAESMKRTAEEFNHTIVATGMAGGRAGIDGFGAFFVLTQCAGETFLCVVNFGDVATIEPWRVHYIAGKDPAKSLLIVEMGPRHTGQQVVVFRRDVARSPTEDSPEP